MGQNPDIISLSEGSGMKKPMRLIKYVVTDFFYINSGFVMTLLSLLMTNVGLEILRRCFPWE